MAPSGTRGATGTSGSNANDSKFTLTHVMSTPGATSAPPPTSASATANSTYRLDAEDSQINPHIGHKVEITGTVEKDAANSSPSATSAMAEPKLKVDSVKMVAATCP